MAENQARSTDTYRLKKVHGYWFLENSYTRKTKRLPFLTSKVNIILEDNYIFADDSVYEIKESDSGVPCIEKIEDLIYKTEHQIDTGAPPPQADTGTCIINDTNSGLVNSPDLEDDVGSAVRTDASIENDNELYYTLQEHDGVIKSVRDINIRSYECGSAEYVESASIKGQMVPTKSDKEQHVTQPRGKGHNPQHNKDVNKEHGKTQPKVDVTYQVVIEETELSKLCGLHGIMELGIHPSGLSFYDTGSKSITYSFFHNWVRRYGQRGDVFTIEVGRWCPNGEGEIKCKTHKASSLRMLVHHIWHDQSKK